jgi:hypothetical protein
MSEVVEVDLKTYKLAKIICKDLKAIIEVFDLNLRGLELYKHYIPVANVLIQMRHERTILELQYKKYQKLFKNKGIIPRETPNG